MKPVDERFMRRGMVARLYAQGYLSEMQACRLLKMTRRAFEEMLPEYGFAAMVDANAQIDAEIERNT